MNERAALEVSGVELRIDRDRLVRTGIAEAVYAPGKSPQQCATAVRQLLRSSDSGPVLLTRADSIQVQVTTEANPGAEVTDAAGGEVGSLNTLVWRRQPRRSAKSLLLTAGTGDLQVAREAAAVLAAYGIGVELVADVGVAGLHRVMAYRAAIADADVVVVVAGMEGALPSVVAGLTRAPVIAVPTSTGYGAGLDGVTALLAMHASCSPGITVVGIDNGFGAACAAVRLFNTLDRS